MGCPARIIRLSDASQQLANGMIAAACGVVSGRPAAHDCAGQEPAPC
jgi:hypothetical protein